MPPAKAYAKPRLCVACFRPAVHYIGKFGLCLRHHEDESVLDRLKGLTATYDPRRFRES